MLSADDCKDSLPDTLGLYGLCRKEKRPTGIAIPSIKNLITMSSISMEVVALILRPYGGKVEISYDIAFVASNTQGHLKQDEIWVYPHCN